MEETKECQVCKTFNIFNNLVELGYEPEYAFHTAVSHLTEVVIDRAVDQAYDKGYETGHLEGYKEATVDLAQIVNAYLEAVENEQ